MNFNIFLLFLSFLLYTSCLSVAGPQSIVLGGAFGPAQQETNGISKRTDLNLDMYVMFQELDLPGLLQTAKSNPTLSAVANDAYHQNYSDFLIYLYYYQKDTDHKVFEYEKRIEIYDSELGVSLLKQFGRSIKKLKVDNGIAARYLDSLKVANEYASESLEYLELSYVRADTLVQFEVPFKQVSEFICYINVKPNGEVLPWNELFPNLRRLSVIFNHEVLGGVTNGEYEHLEHLSLQIMSDDTFDQIDEIELLLLNNPGILSLAFINFPRYDYLRVIHELIPDVENLTVSSVFLNGDELTFERVKHLHMTTHLPGTTKVSFPQLESIQTIFAEYNFENVRTFLQNHHLKRVNIYSWVERNLDHPKLEQLLSEHSDLTELKLLFEDDVSTGVIIRIIRKQTSLERFDFAMRLKPYDESKVDIICAEFESEWQITKIGYDETHPGPQGFHMERKQTAPLE